MTYANPCFAICEVAGLSDLAGPYSPIIQGYVDLSFKLLVTLQDVNFNHCMIIHGRHFLL